MNLLKMPSQSNMDAVPEEDPTEVHQEVPVLGLVAPDHRQPASLISAPTSAPSTAAPGTPVGRLLGRPALAGALARHKGNR